MTTKGVEVFDETVHVTNAWLKDIMAWLHTDDRHLAYRALRSVLHALRDELEPELAVHLGAELPMLVRGFYYEGWRPVRTPARDRHIQAFYNRISGEMQGYSETDPVRLTGAVFDVLAAHVAVGEIQKVARALPRELREMWRIPA
ncbi:DUF2267 domain-containing protein [Azospirillum sp. sgz301742]